MMKEKTINDIIQQKEKVFQGKIWNRYLKDFQGWHHEGYLATYYQTRT